MFIARVLDIETLRRTDTSLSTHEPLVGSSSRASCLKSTSVVLASVCDTARSTFLLLTVPSAVRAYKDLLRCNHRDTHNPDMARGTSTAEASLDRVLYPDQS